MSRMKEDRRKAYIRILPAVLLIIALGFILSSCGEGEEISGEAPGTVIAQDDASITVVDQAGREVTVKKDPESIALCYRVVIRFLLGLEQGDKITGIGKSEPFLEKLQPSLADCADVGKGVADIEALAELKPDLFIHKADDRDTLEAVEEIGIPSIGIEVETPEDMIVCIELLGKVCGAEERAGILVDDYNRRIAASKTLAKGIPEKEKKKAIVMGTSIGKVADGSMLQGKMLELAGAVNCAAELEATELWPTAGTEQIFAWNPDYIFITNSESAVYTAEDLMKDPAWSEVKAVKEKHVFEMPAAEDSWEFPGTVSALGIDYLMNTMYPELLSEEELGIHVRDFYQLTYGRAFSAGELGY